jgi:hypothetical protein
MRKISVLLYIVFTIWLISIGHWIIGGILFLDAIDTPWTKATDEE